jgi:hypothetical protein
VPLIIATGAPPADVPQFVGRIVVALAASAKRPAHRIAIAPIPAGSSAAAGVPLIIAMGASRRTCHLHTFLTLHSTPLRAFGKV